MERRHQIETVSVGRLCGKISHLIELTMGYGLAVQ